MDCIDSCDPALLRNLQGLRDVGGAHSCPEAVFLGRVPRQWCKNGSSSKANSFPWGGEAPLGGHATLERTPPPPGSEIRLPLPSAGFWTREALGVQTVTLVVYGFGEGWRNRLGYLLNLVLACNVLLHERLSGSGQIEHTGSNTAGPQGKAFTWYLLKILSLNEDYIRWPPANLSFEVSSTTLSLIHLIQHEKPPESQMQSTECESIAAEWRCSALNME